MKWMRLALAVLAAVTLAACSDDNSGSSSSSSSCSSGGGDTKTGDSTSAGDTGRGFKDSKQPEGTSLDGTEMAANQLYEGGERLKVSNLGFSFEVPKGEKAYFPAGGAAISVGAQGQDAKFLTLIIARTGVTEAEARDMINKPWDLGGGDQLARTSEIEKNGDRLSCAIASQRMTGFLEMLIGKSTGVAAATLGLPGSEKECKAHCSKLADTIKFAVPGGEKQRQEYETQLMGKCAHIFKYKGSSGYSGTSWGSETNKYWHFGSDRTYEYFSRNTNSGSFESGSYASDNDAGHAGTWSIELTLNLPALILRTTDGRIITHVLNRSATHMTIDGDEAMLKASDRKQ